ncbi:YgjP-like metallopeptidase domain-containing protein [Marinomonas sp. 2405UD68-3]|uniref:YgjP-like metallopeptidase domain-containing protein n=1 Tax=Marinomonas sp. 2405UD68-3 TaxID=3391835 RepID=UPI0039C94058
MIESNRLSDHIRKQYPTTHQISNDKALREFTLTIKNQYLKKSDPLSKIIYDNKIHVVNNALGLHSYASRVQGSKLKNKNEIRISSVFKDSPEAFLRMIVVHELAHLKEKEHNKAFYKVCCHMLPNYHQLEFDMRLYLTHLELLGSVYPPIDKKD